MGQSLFNITCPEDHSELTNNLKYQDETSSSSISELAFHLHNSSIISASRNQ